MKRIGSTLVVLALVSATAYYVFTHPSLSRVERLRSEVDKLREDNERLAEQNEKLEERVGALDEDERLAERRARESSGLARSDEVIFEFDDEDDEEVRVDVALVVESNAVRLAGEEVAVDELDEALTALHEDVPRARLEVRFGDKTDELRRQRVREVVEEAPIKEVEVRSDESAER